LEDKLLPLSSWRIAAGKTDLSRDWREAASNYQAGGYGKLQASFLVLQNDFKILFL
jgi:hypothetical protein